MAIELRNGEPGRGQAPAGREHGQYESLAGSEISEGLRIWIDRFDADPVWGHIRFKVTRMLMVPAQAKFPARLVDVVGAKEFARDEAARLPLFCGTQMGMRPQPSSVLPRGQVRAVGVFGFSVLSGGVAGLSIRSMDPRGAKATLHTAGGETVVPCHRDLGILARFSNASR